MKKSLFTYLSFLFLSLGMICAQEPISGRVEVESNQFFLVPGYSYPNRVSPNGQYVVGVQDNALGYLFNTESNKFAGLGIGSAALDVNSNGTICGTFKDPDFTIDTPDGKLPITVAGVYEQGAWKSLGIGSLDIAKLSDTEEGSQATAISADGKTVGGCLFTNMKITPCTWTKNNDGSWTNHVYDYPSDDKEAQGSKVMTLSGDGTIAGGWAVIELGGPRLPILWKSPTDYTIVSTESSSTGIYSISDNGKYAVFAINNQSVLYYIEEDRYEIIPGHAGAHIIEVTATSDNGIVIGYSQFGDFMKGIWRNGFVYSKEIGFIDIFDFIRVFASNVQLPDEIDSNGQLFTVPMDISADGKVITGWHGPSPAYSTSWILKLTQLQQPLKKPRNVKASITKENHVTLTWEAPESSASKLTGYRIFRNNTSLIITEPNTLTYKDTNIQNNSGRHTYNISAVYEQGESPKTDDAFVIIADSHAIPFFEDFDTGKFETNYWYPDGWILSPFEGRGIYGYGATSKANASTSKSRTLTSKYLDATELNKVYLNYVLRYSIEEVEFGKDTLNVEIAHDGLNWISVKKYIPDTSSKLWKSESIDISTLIIGKFFQVRFRFYGENSKSSTIWDLDNVRVDTVPTKNTQAPSALTGLLSEKKGEITWKTPAKTYELTYLKNNEVVTTGNSGKPFIVAISFGKSDLSLYKGKYLSSISAVINQDDPKEELKIALVVFLNGEKVVNQPVNSFVSTAAWNTFRLETPLLIDESTNDLKIGISIIKQAKNESPIGMDYSQSPTSHGNLYSEDGGSTWLKIYDDMGIRNNLTIIGNLTNTADDETAPKKDENLLGYIIYRNDQDQGFTPLARYTDNDTALGICYTVSAYYKDGLATLPSEPYCLKQDRRIDSNEVERTVVFPNPVSDCIKISGEITKASLFDMNGKKIIETTQNSIPVSQIASGIYLLKIESGTQVTTCKIVKK
jgi:hypothetical protein